MKKKILFFMVSYSKGGTEKVAIDLINNLDGNKYDITLFTIFGDGGYENLVNKHVQKKCFFKRFFRGGARVFTLFPRKMLHKFIIGSKYDIEIAVGDGIPSRIIGGSANKNSKKISWIHMDVVKRGSNLREFKTEKGKHRFYEPFNHIVCVSNDCRISFENKFSFGEKTTVKYNVINAEEIIRRGNEGTKQLFNNYEKNLVTVGRLVEQKGYDRLLKVHKKLINEGLTHKVYIIGNGPKYNEYEQFIKDNHLQESIILLGHQDNPYKYIKQADIFICSSRDEAFSTVLSESVILETPIISTKCAGTEELLGNSEYGLVVENSEDGIYQGIKSFLQDDNVLNIYIKKIKQRKYFFDLDKSIEEWEKLF